MKLNHRRTVAMLVAVAGALVAGCGQTGANSGGPTASRTTTPTPQPSAAQILTKPAMSIMKDMHFTATIQTTSGGRTAQLTGEGDMVVRPSSAFQVKVQGTFGGATVSEEVITRGGTDYVREGAQKFKASPSSQASDVNTWQMPPTQRCSERSS